MWLYVWHVAIDDRRPVTGRRAWTWGPSCLGVSGCHSRLMGGGSGLRTESGQRTALAEIGPSEEPRIASLSFFGWNGWELGRDATWH
jgi:hypothetical protein